MRLLAALASVLAVAGSTVHVPAPAAGKLRVEVLTIKASSMPTLTVTNLSALGTGFHGSYLIGKSAKKPGIYVAALAMFSGSGTAGSSTLSVHISNGTPVGKPVDDTENCSVLDDALDYALGRTPPPDPAMDLAHLIAFKPLKKGDSPPKTEFTNNVEYQAKSVPCP